MDTYINFEPYKIFFKAGGIKRAKEADWHEEGLTYEYGSHNERHMNLTIPVTDQLLKNGSMYLHMQITVRNPLYTEKFLDGENGALEIGGGWR